jgi:hypothetical protein
MQEYQPEIWKVRKDYIYDAIRGLEMGLDYARESLLQHDTNLGRTIRKNKVWAEMMESDIRYIEKALKNLKC